MRSYHFSISIPLLLLTCFICTKSLNAQNPPPPQNLQVEAEVFNVHLWWAPPTNTPNISGYNIYFNNNLIDFTTDTSYIHYNESCTTDDYFVTTVTPNGTSGSSNKPEINISVCYLEYFTDDFETYNPGEQLVCQDQSNWTTWTNYPCSGEDPFVTDEFSFEGNNSIEIISGNDLVLPVPNLGYGLYVVEFKIMVSSDSEAYFNILQQFNPTPEWGLEVYFETSGIGHINAGASNAATFYFDFDTWINIKVLIYCNLDWASLKIDESTIYEWQWSSGANGTGGSNQLGGVNFYGHEFTSKYFIDNFLIGEPTACIPLPPTNFTADTTLLNNYFSFTWTPPGGNCELEGFNIYRNDELLEYITEPHYTDFNSTSGTYEYFATAVYSTIEIFSTDTINLVIPAGTGFSNNTKNEYSVSPNPTKGEITISGRLEINAIHVFNPDGTLLVEEHKLYSMKHALNISNFSNGVYILKIDFDKKSVFTKIVKQ